MLTCLLSILLARNQTHRASIYSQRFDSVLQYQPKAILFPSGRRTSLRARRTLWIIKSVCELRKLFDSIEADDWFRTMELQSQTIVRRYPDMRIASLRLHYTIPNREFAMREDSWRQRGDLWGWVQQDSAADAFLRAITAEEGAWSGHEAFFIVAPDTLRNQDSRELHELYWAHVPVKEGKSLEGQVSFYDCSKAERLLGWKHKAVPDEAN